MKAIINGRILTPGGAREGALLFDEKIRGVTDHVGDAQIIDARGLYVLPGLVDMHIHGYLGEDASDGKAEGILKMAEGIVKNGVTSWLPTTMTVSMDDLETAFDAVSGLMKPGANPKGASILGVNAEGPFISPGHKGAQAGEHIRPLDAAFLRRHSDIIRVFTVAPEMPGNLSGIREIAAEGGMLVSLGHTGATYDEAIAAIDAGAGHATHLFNAMTPLKHRDPGVVGAALLHDGVSVELIADCFHVHPDLFSMVARLKGEKLVLITDCTRAGGLADGEYSLGGQPIFVKGVECRLKDGTIAGSVLKLNQAVANVRRHTGLPMETVVSMASLNPARAIGVSDRKGSLETGKDADIVLADGDLTVHRTIIAGETVYEKED